MANSHIDGIISNIETVRERGNRYDLLTIIYAGETREHPHREMRVQVPLEHPFLLNDHVRVKDGRTRVLERTTDAGKTLESYACPDQNAA